MGFHNVSKAREMLLLLCTLHSNYTAVNVPLPDLFWMHQIAAVTLCLVLAQSCAQTEAVLTEPIQHIHPG